MRFFLTIFFLIFCSSAVFADVFVETALLYWTAWENGLGYAVKDGHVKDPDFEWDWGFKLGVGYLFEKRKWDLFLGLTHLHVQGKTDAHGSLIPLWTKGVRPIAERIQGKWRLHFGMLDLEGGQTFSITKWLELRPYFDLKGAMIRQKYIIFYDDDRVFMTNKFWGVGPGFGIDTLWKLGYGIGIYGIADFAFLFGKFRVHKSEKDQFRIMRHFDQTVPVIDLMGGLCWGTPLYNDRFYLTVYGGWDEHFFFNQNQWRNGSGDLALQGATLGIRFDL